MTTDSGIDHARRVLFLPGAAGAPEFWHPVGAELPASWTKTYLGWPGLGGQPPDPTVNSLDDLTRLTLSALNGPTTLVAQSMGGIMALRLALNRPDLVDRLILVATSGGLDMASFGASDWRPDYLATFPDAPSWFVEAHPDLSADLGSLSMPTLLIWGDADTISPLAVGRELARCIPRSRLVVISGGDHGLAVSHAMQVASLIEEFLAEAGPA